MPRLQWRKLRSVRALLLSMTPCLVIQPLLALAGMSDASCAEQVVENLLKNPGFESGANRQPDEWRHFIAPADGAEAVWDEAVHRSGKRSVRLNIETPYAEEVYNNWYQHVTLAPVGEQLNLSGYIRSRNVTEAALWLQCWRQGSQDVLRFATTSVDCPVSGTVDWTRVETSIVPPPETAFVTVRCIVAGKGTVWFDDLRLATEQQPDDTPLVEKAEEEANKADQHALKELLEAHKTLLEVNKDLAENARLLMEEVARLRQELDEMKLSMEEQRSAQEEKNEKQKRTRIPPFRPAAGRISTKADSELSP